MTFDLIIKPIVFWDVDDAVVYYESQLIGLGKRFYNQILFSFEQIQAKPFKFSYVKYPVRRYKIIKFPYKIYYIISNNIIFIIGISHAKRSNAFVKNRIKIVE